LSRRLSKGERAHIPPSPKSCDKEALIRRPTFPVFNLEDQNKQLGTALLSKMLLTKKTLSNALLVLLSLGVLAAAEEAGDSVRPLFLSDISFDHANESLRINSPIKELWYRVDAN
jgi:hypothetical protein